eukprot:GDKJ01031226.1.p1 GENE.GDKJ01031226.1~~GDKJ01031226.1.p1  ORF type:complete len:247 (-),score=50.95 GDKJ01031226.1:218-958(-)
MAKKVIALFDLDGTLSEARKTCTSEMIALLRRLRETVTVGVVSGSDKAKVLEQLGHENADVCDYLFVENGVVAYQKGELIGSESIAKFLGEENLKELINFVLRYFSEVDIPIKRGTFIEYRTGMLNLSPIGRACSYEERLEFYELDKKEGIRSKFVAALQENFGERFKLRFSIGGQISVDCFPEGWDKTYCLKYIEKEFDEIHFFGDKTFPGGNDFEIFADKRTIGHTVVDPADTTRQLYELFGTQ